MRILETKNQSIGTNTWHGSTRAVKPLRDCIANPTPQYLAAILVLSLFLIMKQVVFFFNDGNGVYDMSMSMSRTRKLNRGTNSILSL